MKLKKLKSFCEEQDISYAKGLQIAHAGNSPFVKIDRLWYVDVDKFEKWLEEKSHDNVI